MDGRPDNGIDQKGNDNTEKGLYHIKRNTGGRACDAGGNGSFGKRTGSSKG